MNNENETSSRDRFGSVVTSVCLILYLSMIVGIIIQTGSLSFFSKVSPLRFLAAAVLWLAFGVVICRIKKKKIAASRKALDVCVVIWVLFQVYYVWACWQGYNSDAMQVAEYAYYAVSHVTAVIPKQLVNYFAVCSNNAPLGMIVTFFSSLVASRTSYEIVLFLSCIAAVFADLAILGTMKLVRMICGSAYELPAFLVLVLFIGLSEQSTILYTDILSLWTLPWTILLLTRSANSKVLRGKIINSVLAGAVISFGVWLKPQVFVFVIAFIMISLISALRKDQRAVSCRKTVIVFLLTMSMALPGLRYLRNQWLYTNVGSKEYIEQNEYTVLHFVDMGLNPETGGAWSQSDNLTLKSYSGHQAKNQFLMSSIKERISSYGTAGLLKFEYWKLVRASGNGTFAEGSSWRGAMRNDSKYAAWVREYLVGNSQGWSNGLAVIQQVGYILMLILMIAYIFTGRNRHDSAFTRKVLCLMLIGIALFSLLFECNFRYYYTFLPVIILLSFCSLASNSGFSGEQIG